MQIVRSRHTGYLCAKRSGCGADLKVFEMVALRFQGLRG